MLCIASKQEKELVTACMGRQREATALTHVVNNVTNVLIDGTRLYGDIRCCETCHAQMNSVIKETGEHRSEKREGIKIGVDEID